MKQIVIVMLLATSAFGADFTASLKAGKADIKFAGPLAFGRDGVLFVGDSLGSAVYAIDTQDRTPVTDGGEVEIKDLDKKIAAVVGASPDQLLLNDMAVNPVSKNIYLSLSRGRGPAGEPVIIRVERDGKLSLLPLEDVRAEILIGRRNNHDDRGSKQHLKNN